MRPVVLAAVVTLGLLSSACASRIAHAPARPRPAAKPAGESKAEPVKAGGFGNGDAPIKRPGAPLISATPGAAADPHSDVASKTPDGGKSASVSATRTSLDGALATEGADHPGASDAAKRAGAAEAPSGERPASGPGGDGAAATEDDSNAAADAGAKPSAVRPVDESDPSVDTSPLPNRART